MTKTEMKAVFETYKVFRNLEDNPEELSERLVDVKSLVTNRLTKRAKRVDDLIAIEKDKIQQ